jgi:hypothetical protein
LKPYEQHNLHQLRSHNLLRECPNVVCFDLVGWPHGRTRSAAGLASPWVATAQTGAQRRSLITTFASPTSIMAELPRVLLSLAHQQQIWEVVEASGAFALHLLSEAQLSWVWRFGLQSGRAQNKWAGVGLRSGMTGGPVLLAPAGGKAAADSSHRRRSSAFSCQS